MKTILFKMVYAEPNANGINSYLWTFPDDDPTHNGGFTILAPCEYPIQAEVTIDDHSPFILDLSQNGKQPGTVTISWQYNTNDPPQPDDGLQLTFSEEPA